MLSIATGYNPRYLTGEVAKGTENYYTREVRRGEPPGIWQGGGAAPLGLVGTVNEKDMEALYVHFVDPRDPGFRGSRADWRRAARLGQPPRKYSTADELFVSALAREPHAEPERLEALRRDAERRARKPVAFIDLTFGVPKSFSILHTALRALAHRSRVKGNEREAVAWEGRARLLEQAIWAGNNAALNYLQDRAGYSRAGYHGIRTPTGGTAGRWIDAHGWIVASFLQHSNRNEDMHLHIHNGVLNRVFCADGKWRTLDSRGIHRIRGAAAAIGERVMTEDAVKNLGIGVRWSENGHALEIAGVTAQERALFSSRRREVTTAVKRLAARFEERHGRAPNALELTRLSAEAAKATRHRKRKAKETPEQLFDRVERQLRSIVADTLDRIAHRCLNPGAGLVADLQQPAFDIAQVIGCAVNAVQSTKSAWTRFDLIRALHEALPPYLGGLDQREVADLLERLADLTIRPTGHTAADVADVVCLDAPEMVAVPDELRHVDGRSVFEAPAEQVFATRQHLQAEAALLTGVTTTGGARRLDSAAIDDWIARLACGGTELGADQANAIRGLLASTQQAAMLIGPAGTGKSFVMGAVVGLWREQTGREALGLATGQRAAQVLADEGFTRYDNLSRWLQHQDRLDAGDASHAELASRLEAGDLVVLDEAAMTPTADLAAVYARCAAAAARLILVGDDRQLEAVGAGGAFRLMAQYASAVFTLNEVRRFSAPWEGGASLRLRNGEHEVVSVYERHARILDAGTTEQAEEMAAQAWLADTLAGLQSLVLVSTGEQAADVSARMRARLVDLGLVEADGIALHHKDAIGTVAGAGDLVQTRRNDWQLWDAAGRAVINRDVWLVSRAGDDGGLEVRRILGQHQGSYQLAEPVQLPAEYVSQHVTLAYAVTAHSAQGTTVDTSYPIITARTTPSALYVGMTRGKFWSIAHVATKDDIQLAKPQAVQVILPGQQVKTPGQVLAAILGRTSPDLSATEIQRDLLISSATMPILGMRWTEATSLAGQRQLDRLLHKLTSDGYLTTEQHTAIASDEATGPLQRLLRLAELAGHNPEPVLAQAISASELATARSIAQVLHWRIIQRHGDKLTPQADSWRERTPTGDDPVSKYALDVAEAMDSRCAQLGEQAAAQPPRWAEEALGPVPEHTPGYAQWCNAAGVVAGYREQYQTGTDTDPIGPCPALGRPDARAAWFAAWRALGSPAKIADESTMDIHTLHATISAYHRAKQWAPDWVGGPLRHHLNSARTGLQAAAILRAQAHVESDDRRRATLLVNAAAMAQKASDSSELAAGLEIIDAARAEWHAYSQPMRQAAERATAELARRGLAIINSGSADRTVADVCGGADQQVHSRAASAFTHGVAASVAKAKAATERIKVEQAAEQLRQRRQRAGTTDIHSRER
jgi:hypothetical protein